MREVMCQICGVLVSIGGVFAGLYIGAWKLFLLPIATIFSALDAGMLTEQAGIVCLVKILLASPVGIMVAAIGFTIGFYLYNKFD